MKVTGLWRLADREVVLEDVTVNVVSVCIARVTNYICRAQISWFVGHLCWFAQLKEVYCHSPTGTSYWNISEVSLKIVYFYKKTAGTLQERDSFDWNWKEWDRNGWQQGNGPHLWKNMRPVKHTHGGLACCIKSDVRMVFQSGMEQPTRRRWWFAIVRCVGL